jgi:hypothetical protein
MSVFELVSPTGAAPSLPGPWEGLAAPPPPAEAGLSFSARAGEQEAAPLEAPLWRANLPADLAGASAQLAVGEASVLATRVALASAPARLDAALGRRPVGVSFSTVAEPRPEAQLFGLLGALEQDPNTVSFGIGEDLKAGWQQANAQFQRFAAQAREAIGNYAVVETRTGELLIGRTTVSWVGDMRTCWPRAIAGEQADLHRRMLALALESRAAMLRTVILVLRGAGLVAQAVSSPIGAVTAIPAAWKFISEIINETA